MTREQIRVGLALGLIDQEVEKLPDSLIAWWNRASEDLREAEIAIKEALNEQSS